MTSQPIQIKTIDTPKTSYTEVFSETNTTVAQLYDVYRKYFPVEYSVLINPVRIPEGNGYILRFSKNSNENYVKIVQPKAGPVQNFSDEELDDLSNCRVFLEPYQTELNYMVRWFKYSMAERKITDYRLRQMYWMSKLDSESEDDYKNDPDYIPSDEDSEDSDVDSVDEDKSPDYTPSVESEQEEEDTDSEDDADNEVVISKYALLKQKLKQQYHDRKHQNMRNY